MASMLALRCKSFKFTYSPMVVLTGALPEMRFPSGFDDVAIRVEALHADVLGLIPLLDDRDSVACEAVSESSDGIRTWKTDPEVEESRQPDRLLSRAEGERESVCVVEHQHSVVIPARGFRVESEVRLVEAA